MVLWNPCLWVSKFEKHFKEVASNTPTPSEAQIAGAGGAHILVPPSNSRYDFAFPRRRSPEMRSSFRLFWSAHSKVQVEITSS
jgi:hypothetical protein